MLLRGSDAAGPGSGSDATTPDAYAAAGDHAGGVDRDRANSDRQSLPDDHAVVACMGNTDALDRRDTGHSRPVRTSAAHVHPLADLDAIQHLDIAAYSDHQYPDEHACPYGHLYIYLDAATPAD